MALLEFPSREQALEWHGSTEYRPLRDLREEAADSVLVLTADHDPVTPSAAAGPVVTRRPDPTPGSGHLAEDGIR